MDEKELKEEQEKNQDEEKLRIQQERYQKQLKTYQNYVKIMRYFAFSLCGITAVALIIGGICMVTLNLGVGAIVAGAIMILLAPIVVGMLTITLFYEKHPEKLKDRIMKRAKAMKAKQDAKAEKKKANKKE